MTAPRRTPNSPSEHAESDARDEVFNRVARISAMLEAQAAQQTVHEEVITRAMYIAAETDVHSRRGRDVRKG